MGWGARVGVGQAGVTRRAECRLLGGLSTGEAVMLGCLWVWNRWGKWGPHLRIVGVQVFLGSQCYLATF